MARRAYTVNFTDTPLLSSKDTMNCAEKVMKISHFNQNFFSTAGALVVITV